MVVTQYGNTRSGCSSSHLGPAVHKVTDVWRGGYNPLFPISGRRHSDNFMDPAGVLETPAYLTGSGAASYSGRLFDVSASSIAGGGMALCSRVYGDLCVDPIPFCCSITKDSLTDAEVSHQQLLREEALQDKLYQQLQEQEQEQQQRNGQAGGRALTSPQNDAQPAFSAPLASRGSVPSSSQLSQFSRSQPGSLFSSSSSSSSRNQLTQTGSLSAGFPFQGSGGFEGSGFSLGGSSFSRERQRGEERPCLLYTSPSPRDMYKSRMPSSA